MNITYIVNVFPKISETFVLDQITYLIDQGHTVNIIAAENRNEQVIHQAVFDYNLQEKTFYPKRTPQAPGIELSPELISTLLFTDIIHAHFANWPAQIAMNLSLITGIPFIFTAHAYDIFNRPDITLLKQLAITAKKIITVSEYNTHYLTDLLGENIKEKLTIIRCPINLKKQKANIPSITNSKPVVLVCGRFVAKKGIPYAIKAFALAIKTNPAELRIIGDGPMKEEIETLIEELQIGQDVKLLGELNHANVFEQMNEADIFLLPSVTAENGDREGLPVSILEAQALELPVVSTFHSGIPEGVLNGKTGFLVPERDVEALAEKLILLLKDKNVRTQLGQNGRNHIKKHFNSQLEHKKTKNLMADVISETNTPIKYSQNTQKIVGDRLQALFRLIPAQSSLPAKDTIPESSISPAVLNEKMAKKDIQIDQLSEKLNHIRNTLSWKLTKPLRILGRYTR